MLGPQRNTLTYLAQKIVWHQEWSMTIGHEVVGGRFLCQVIEPL